MKWQSFTVVTERWNASIGERTFTVLSTCWWNFRSGLIQPNWVMDEQQQTVKQQIADSLIKIKWSDQQLWSLAIRNPSHVKKRVARYLASGRWLELQTQIPRYSRNCLRRRWTRVCWRNPVWSANEARPNHKLGPTSDWFMDRRIVTFTSLSRTHWYG